MISYNNDTIAAIATATGESGIAIVRMSGSLAIPIDSLFSGAVTSYLSHSVHLGQVFSTKKEVIDSCLLLVMKNPKSFTGEDVVEFQCHGGFFASKKILEALIEKGARLALPGEFSFRAFINGKIDLSQAEAIQHLISAKNEQAFQIAKNQFSGGLSKKIKEIQNSILKIAATIEALHDFPDEDLQINLSSKTINDLCLIIENIENLTSSYDEGRRLILGSEVSIIGSPNSGKSSLLNALTNQERAIVSSIPGTTRDLIKEDFMLEGKLIKLVDTAGIRETTDIIEKEGIKKAQHAINYSSLILYVIDSTNPLYVPINLDLTKTIIVWNKQDLTSNKYFFPKAKYEVHISTKTGEGLFQLKKLIKKLLDNLTKDKSDIFLVSERHYTILLKTLNFLKAAKQGLQLHIFPEIISIEIRSAIETLGEILGTHVSEQILEQIFNTFCIGK